MKRCKYCGKEFEKTTGLRNFCSRACKLEYTRKITRERVQKHRQKRVTLNNPIKDIHNPCNAFLEPSYAMKKAFFESEFGSRDVYEVAKNCCNFETKMKEGYCLTLYEPYYLFKKRCKECFMLELLKTEQSKRRCIYISRK